MSVGQGRHCGKINFLKAKAVSSQSAKQVCHKWFQFFRLIAYLCLSFRRSTLITCRDASGYSPLHYAALNGHRQIVSYLLAAEADLLAKDKKGCIPLHLAAFSGQKEIVQMLLAHDVSRQSVNAQNFAKEIPVSSDLCVFVH